MFARRYSCPSDLPLGCQWLIKHSILTPAYFKEEHLIFFPEKAVVSAHCGKEAKWSHPLPQLAVSTKALRKEIKILLQLLDSVIGRT